MQTDIYYRGYRLSTDETGTTRIYYDADLIDTTDSRREAEEIVDYWKTLE